MDSASATEFHIDAQDEQDLVFEEKWLGFSGRFNGLGLG